MRCFLCVRNGSHVVVGTGVVLCTKHAAEKKRAYGEQAVKKLEPKVSVVTSAKLVRKQE